jgi:hypothetical protein
MKVNKGHHQKTIVDRKNVCGQQASITKMVNNLMFDRVPGKTKPGKHFYFRKETFYG